MLQWVLLLAFVICGETLQIQVQTGSSTYSGTAHTITIWYDQAPDSSSNTCSSTIVAPALSSFFSLTPNCGFTSNDMWRLRLDSSGTSDGWRASIKVKNDQTGVWETWVTYTGDDSPWVKEDDWYGMYPHRQTQSPPTAAPQTLAPAVMCDAFSCPADWSPKPGSASIPCASNPLQVRLCVGFNLLETQKHWEVSDAVHMTVMTVLQYPRRGSVTERAKLTPRPCRSAPMMGDVCAQKISILITAVALVAITIGVTCGLQTQCPTVFVTETNAVTSTQHRPHLHRHHRHQHPRQWHLRHQHLQ